MNYAFYPGCSLDATAWDFDKSTRAVCKALGIELTDIPGWVCCGSTPAHASNASLAVALPVFNLQKAQEMGCDGVLTVCASCYARLRTANHKVTKDPEERERAARITEKPYDGSLPVRHLLDVLIHEVGTRELRKKVQARLKGLRVACYYGCLLSRPPEVVAFEDAENPKSMEELLKAAGAEGIDWPYKTECCGASIALSNPAMTNRLGHRLLAMAEQAGADCVAVACPLCQMNLDLRQADIKKAHGGVNGLPVVYITQILGLALGLTPDELGLGALTVDAKVLLEKRGAAKEATGTTA